MKQLAVREYANKFQLRILVETGTYICDMVDAVAADFDAVYSIEISPDLYTLAREHVSGRPNVHLLLGDSAEVLPELLPSITEPCLFWLDGHYSAGITALGSDASPLLREIREIGEHPLAYAHVLLIDDARSFDGTGGYPTIAQVRDSLRQAGFDEFETSGDITRAYRANRALPR